MKSKRYKLPNTLELDPATSYQKEYATSLNITLPDTATKSDAKAIMDRHLDEDIPAPQTLIYYAKNHEILCSDYIGYKFLHNLMFDNLSPLDLAAFFCYCVYQDIVEEYHEDLDTHPHSEVFYQFANKYEKDFYFETSLKDYYGEDLLAFGKHTVPFPDGSKRTLYGGSKQTTAYKLALEHLTDTLELSIATTRPPSALTPKTSLFPNFFGKKNN